MSNSNKYEDNKGNLNWKDNTIDWKDMIKKEARGYAKGDDLGEVQEIGQEFVVTERGRIKKNKFYLPKHLVQGYDGDTLWFNITEEDAEDNFKKDHPPKEGEYSRYKTASVTEQYDTTSSPSKTKTTTAASQGSGYNIEERLPLIEKKDSIRNTTTGTKEDTLGASGILDWDSIIHKGVRTKDMQPVGNVTAVTDDSIVITSEGARDEFNVPKEEVEAFNGAEVSLNATIDRFEQFRVKVAR
ncbi:MAG: hypothetical protein M3Z01_09595 [Thermoproteota archaeon]|nr:hypothetical protein [Thermoproteota archaeon]